MKYPQYPFVLALEENEGRTFWTAKSTVLNGCVSQGVTQKEALVEFVKNEEAWLETAKEFDIEIPKNKAQTIPQYSGKFTTRVSPRTHEQATVVAKRQGISLNQLVGDALVAYLASSDTRELGNDNSTLRELMEEVQALKDAVLHKPNKPVEETSWIPRGTVRSQFSVDSRMAGSNVYDFQDFKTDMEKCE